MACRPGTKHFLTDSKGIHQTHLLLVALCLTLIPACDADFDDNTIQSGPVFSEPTPDISIPHSCYAPNATIVIRKHNPSNNPSKDWIWVPKDSDWWAYMPDIEYRYQAPDQPGSYELRFYWNDAGDNDWKSRLYFQVDEKCL